jgi:hypothetical protein
LEEWRSSCMDEIAEMEQFFGPPGPGLEFGVLTDYVWDLWVA